VVQEFELVESEKEIQELIQIDQITNLLLWGIGATVTIKGLGSPAGQRAAVKIAKGVGIGLAGSAIRLGKLEQLAAQTLGAGARKAGIVAKVGARKAAPVLVATTKGAGKVALKFVGPAFAAGEATLGALREKEEDGDVAQIIAGAIVGFVTGVTFTQAFIPKGIEGEAFTRTTDGSLVLQQGGKAGAKSFFTIQGVTDVVGEAIRLLVTG